MPYYDFMEREDVYQIISSTLEKYFDANVSVYEQFPSCLGQIFYCYPRLNAIVPKNYNSKIIDFIKRDNRITNSIVRKIIMSIYIYLAFKFPRIFSNKYIVINNSNISLKDILIYPGNKKVKVIDFYDNTIDNILKTGFDNTWFNKELEIREIPKWRFISPLKRIDSKSYREKFLIGYPFTRIRNKNKPKFLNEINENIEEMQQEGRICEICSYSVELNNKFQTKINNIKDKLKDCEYLNLNKFFNNISNSLLNCFNEIKLAFSHGDLQEGNIFIEDKILKLWILDWETAEERSTYYDKLIFYYNLRNSSKLIDNLKNIYKEKGSRLNLNYGKSLKEIIKLFILEDIIWQIDETKILPDGVLSNGLVFYISTNNQVELLKLL